MLFIYIIILKFQVLFTFIHQINSYEGKNVLQTLRYTIPILLNMTFFSTDQLPYESPVLKPENNITRTIKTVFSNFAEFNCNPYASLIINHKTVDNFHV